MLGRKCTLCGGKLDGRNICTECGLDNSKSDKNYRINQSDCDHMPLTHVHDEPKKQKSRGTKMPDVSRMPKSPYQQKKGRGCLIAAIVVFIIFIVGTSVAGNLIANLVDRSKDYSEDEIYVRDDPYFYVDVELPTEGETSDFELESGRYIVGVNIPAGYYTAEAEYEYDTVQVDDSENGIYLYEYEDREDNCMNDIRLFDGALLTIETETTIMLHTENAQPLAECMENPLSEEYVLEDGESYVMGTHFDAGVYDVMVMDGYGSLDVAILDDTGESRENIYLSMGEYGSDGMIYRNLVLPEGAIVTCDEGLYVNLVPSPVIESTDYAGYYDRY